MSTSGCWFQAGVGPGRTAFNDLETTVTAANVSQLVPDWTASLGGPIGSEPLVDGANVYARSDGRLSSFDLGTGAVRWSVPAGKSGDIGGGSAAVPALDDGWLWVPTPGQACTLLQVNPADGNTVGQRVYNGLPADQVPPTAIRLGGCRTGDALAAGSWIVVPSIVQVIVDSNSLPGGPACPPGVTDLFITSARLSAIDLVRDQGWSLSQDASSCGSPPATPVPFQGVSQSGDQLVVTRGSTVSAYPLAGCPFRQPCPATWSLDIGSQITGSPVVLSNGDIAVSGVGGTTVIDGTSHTVEWTASVGSTLAATPTSIFVVSSVPPGVTTIVSALPAGGCGAATCTPTWTATLQAGPSGRASIGGDVVYVGHGRVVSALPVAGCGADTCAPLWEGTTTTTQGISSPPVIDNGELLVGNRAGTVAAFSLPA
ncbi:MAG TPA: PQQ-binding-like beta-propeller repeat protein [Acidimicrobiales bacterium]